MVLRWVWLVGVVGAGTLVAGLAVTPAVEAAHELDGRDIVAGEALYGEFCASCHGANLEGQPNWQRQNADGTLPAPPHDVTGHTWHHGNRHLFDYTKLGGAAFMEGFGMPNFKSAMPAFGDTLSDDDIWDVLAFIQSTWPGRAQEIQAARNPPHD